MAYLAFIKGKWVEYTHRSRFKLRNHKLLGVSNQTQWNGVSRLHPNKFYFYKEAKKKEKHVYEPMIKEYPVNTGRLNHLMESAIRLKDILEAERYGTRTPLYHELCKMIDEGVKYEKVIKNDLMVHQWSAPQF